MAISALQFRTWPSNPDYFPIRNWTERGAGGNENFLFFILFLFWCFCFVVFVLEGTKIFPAQGQVNWVSTGLIYIISPNKQFW